MFCHDRIPLLLLLGGTLRGSHGCGDDLPLTLGVNQIENEFPSLGDELAAFLGSDQRGGGRWGYLRYLV